MPADPCNQAFDALRRNIHIQDHRILLNYVARDLIESGLTPAVVTSE
ncbi:hypothetical protein [Streptomyces sp. NPDC016845]